MLLTSDRFRKAIAETVGTFFIVFVGCGAMMVADRFPGSGLDGKIPLLFGLSVAAMVYAVGHISGAHFNPVVTLAFAIARHFPKQEVWTYWLAQFGGAGLAILALHLLLPPGASHGATVFVVSTMQALAWEALLTFALMFVIIAVATDTRAEGTMAGAAIGATVMMNAFLGGAVTGASMNPARSLAPAIADGRFDSLWIYFAGPAIGAIAAGFLYQWIRCEQPTLTQKEAKGCC